MATPNPLQVPDLNYYEVLGVEATATSEEVKKAYKKQALYIHPDKASDASNDAWLKLSKAYEVISDKEKRADYDRLRRKEKPTAKGSSRATGPLLRLPDGSRLSSDFPMWYRQWVSAGKVVKMGQFPASLVDNLRIFMNGPLQEIHLSTSKLAAELALPGSWKVQNLADPLRVAAGKTVQTQKSSEEVHGFTYDQLVSMISSTMDDPNTTRTVSALQKILEETIKLSRLKQNKQA